MSKKPIMTEQHPRWTEFYNRLGKAVGTSNCHMDLSNAIEILSAMGFDTQATSEYLEAHGGFCDCEILMNMGIEQ